MRDVIFKGATRPPMMLGVPIAPFIGLLCPVLIGTMWCVAFKVYFAAVCVLLTGGACFLALRFISKDDDHRLNHVLMWLRNARFRANSKHWGAHSMSPIDFDKRG